MSALPPTLPFLPPALRGRLLDIVEAEMGGFDRVDRVVLHREGMQPDPVAGVSKIGIAILVTADPSHWAESWRVEDRLNQALADQGLVFGISLLRASEARQFRRCQNHLPARVLLTGVSIWPQPPAGPPDELPYSEALAGTAAQSARRAANWLTQVYWRPCSFGEACALAYRAACEFVKVPLIQADLAVWHPAVRWRLDRLLAMAAWLDPRLAAWADCPALAVALRPDYFVAERELETRGFPPRTETEARAALAAAWRIGRRFAHATWRRNSAQPAGRPE